MKLIDSHVHLWDPINTPREVSFLNKVLGFNPKLLDKVATWIFPKSAIEFFGSPQYITRPYLLSDYSMDCDRYNVEGIVHVEAGWKGKGRLGPVGETRWLVGVNSISSPKILASIVNANLEQGSNVESILKAHLNASNLVRGVRETLTWQANKRILNGGNRSNLINDTEWRKGFEVLSKFDLSFEATIYDNQIDDLSKLARTYSKTNIMLSHLGTPISAAGEFGGFGKTKSDRDEIIKSWEDKILKLAENKNVFVKLSGLAMPICGFGWHNNKQTPSAEQVANSFSPFINHAIKAFGVDRCLFGSNYPIDKVSLPLTTLINAFELILTEMTDDNRQKIFYQNALKFYKIAPEST